MPLNGETKSDAFDHWRQILEDWTKEDSGQAELQESEATIADVLRLYSERLQNRLQLGEIEAITIEHKNFHRASFAAAVDTSLPVSSLKPFHVTE